VEEAVEEGPAEEPDEPLVLTFVPPLAAVLLAAAKEKGQALTEDEVLRLRDGAICIALPAPVAHAMEEKRGYRDLDPDDVWREWLALRTDPPAS
jgi:hypothetical protein